MRGTGLNKLQTYGKYKQRVERFSWLRWAGQISESKRQAYVKMGQSYMISCHIKASASIEA